MAARRYSIGRANDCDVVVADPSVSRRHAELEVGDNHVLVLIDCQSTQGTHVVEHGRPRRVTREVLSPAHDIRLGDVTLSVGELVDALRTRHPALTIPGFSGNRVEPAPGDARRLVRCSCGVIKAPAQSCPECGR